SFATTISSASPRPASTSLTRPSPHFAHSGKNHLRKFPTPISSPTSKKPLRQSPATAIAIIASKGPSTPLSLPPRIVSTPPTPSPSSRTLLSSRAPPSPNGQKTARTKNSLSGPALSVPSASAMSSLASFIFPTAPFASSFPTPVPPTAANIPPTPLSKPLASLAPRIVPLSSSGPVRKNSPGPISAPPA